MYNLLMHSWAGRWDDPSTSLELDRFLEHTHEAIAAKFRALGDAEVAALRSVPALFGYERGVEDVARVGRITAVQRGSQKLTLTWEFDPAVPPIQPQMFQSLYGALDISKDESYRTHWAVKEVDLSRVLAQAGIMTSKVPPPSPPPKVFISYSWDSPEHEQWVARFAAFLRGRGIDVLLDKWHVRPGGDLAVFMEQSVKQADRVLLICTEKYVEKATGRTGGVGYEHVILTTELMQNLGTHKFIPIVRQQRQPPVLPPALATRLRFDLSDGPHHAQSLEALVLELHGIQVPIPPLGPRPYA